MSKRKNIDECTILVNSCDSYEDLWEPFFSLFYKYWPDCPYQIILNTESKSYNFKPLDIKSFKLFNSDEKISYGRRIRENIKRIETPLIIILLDDFFLRNAVNQNKIYEIVNWLKNNPDIACFNFDHVPDEYNIKDNRFPGFERRSQYGEYRFNMQASIWRKDELYNAWKNFESPWQWELYGNMRSWRSKMNIYSLEKNVKSPIDYGKRPGLTWGVVRGKWVKSDVERLFIDYNINIDLSVRGFYNTTNNEDNIMIDKIKILRSIGVVMFVRFSLWYFKLKFKQVMYKENKSEAYKFSEYLNSKRRLKR